MPACIGKGSVQESTESQRCWLQEPSEVSCPAFRSEQDCPQHWLWSATAPSSQFSLTPQDGDFTASLLSCGRAAPPLRWSCASWWPWNSEAAICGRCPALYHLAQLRGVWLHHLGSCLSGSCQLWADPPPPPPSQAEPAWLPQLCLWGLRSPCGSGALVLPHLSWPGGTKTGHRIQVQPPWGWTEGENQSLWPASHPLCFPLEASDVCLTCTN